MKNIILKRLTSNNISKDYLNWLNDWDIIKFTEQRFKKTTIKDIKKYINDVNKSKNNFIYSINVIEKNKIKHIGNIKIGSIDFYHKRGEISYIIGNKNYWNKGIGSRAIAKVIIIARKKFKIKKIIAGVYSINRPSIAVLKKNKFKKEAKLNSHIVFNRRRYTSYIYGRIL
jgi:ribosomal-protein-alanine N-acetyltransferase